MTTNTYSDRHHGTKRKCKWKPQCRAVVAEIKKTENTIGWRGSWSSWNLHTLLVGIQKDRPRKKIFLAFFYTYPIPAL